MKRALARVAFATCVVVLMLVLVTAILAGFQAFFSPDAGRDGLYRGSDPPVFVAVAGLAASLWGADRIVSFLFRAAGISEGRWSLLRSR